MKLSTKVSIQKIRVIATYQRKEDNPIFAALLQSAHENNDGLTIEEAQECLSGTALNHRMWSNILDRLAGQGYFRKEEQISKKQRYIRLPQKTYVYRLTDFGKETAKQKTFFKSMKGELEVWVLKDEITWFPYPIVKIKERVERNSKSTNEKTKDFDIPQKQILSFKNGDYRIDECESICMFLREEDLTLEVKASQNYVSVSIEDLEFELKLTNNESTTKSDLEQLFLTQEYQEDYDEDGKVVFVSFDGNVQFRRKVKLQEPQIGEVSFNSISLENIVFQPSTKEDAEKWRLAWMHRNLSEYIFEEPQFKVLDEKIRTKFEPYWELDDLPLLEMNHYLENNGDNYFYTLMKLQAPQLLTY